MKSHTILTYHWRKPGSKVDVWHQVKAWSSDYVEETTGMKEMDLLGLGPSILMRDPAEILSHYSPGVEGRIL